MGLKLMVAGYVLLALGLLTIGAERLFGPRDSLVGEVVALAGGVSYLVGLVVSRIRRGGRKTGQE